MQKEGWIFSYSPGGTTISAFHSHRLCGLVHNINSSFDKDEMGRALKEFSEYVKERYTTIDWSVLKEQKLSLSLYWGDKKVIYTKEISDQCQHWLESIKKNKEHHYGKYRAKCKNKKFLAWYSPNNKVIP